MYVCVCVCCQCWSTIHAWAPERPRTAVNLGFGHSLGGAGLLMHCHDHAAVPFTKLVLFEPVLADPACPLFEMSPLVERLLCSVAAVPDPAVSTAGQHPTPTPTPSTLPVRLIALPSDPADPDLRRVQTMPIPLNEMTLQVSTTSTITTLRRKDHWLSMAAAQAYFRTRPPFATFDPRTLEHFWTQLLIPDTQTNERVSDGSNTHSSGGADGISRSSSQHSPGGVRLRTPRQTEACFYSSYNRLWSRLPALGERVPVTVFVGQNSRFLGPATHDVFRLWAQHVQVGRQ